MKGSVQFLIHVFILLAGLQTQAQHVNKQLFTRQDTLRGTITSERAWWDALKYDIRVTPDFNSKTIRGINIITYKTLFDRHPQHAQIDLQEPLTFDSILVGGKKTSFKKDGNAYFVLMPQMKKNAVSTIELHYHGVPVEATNPPWNGGWIWKKDKEGNPWMAVACQELGASVWYPCKDHQSDEPDSASLTLTVPDSLTGIGNGRLKSQTRNDNGTTTYVWSVQNPINNYNIIPYIGKYTNWTEMYSGEKGKLDCSYWVLSYNLNKAREQFRQVPMMLAAFESWFGPFPFYEDGYKLVEAPYLGMEHQSGIAYGNNFQNGYLGTDLSGTGWGLKWDYIIVHESGHEWFGNNITSRDIADLWIHESFTDYSETVFTQARFGIEAGNEYIIGTRKMIRNEFPIIGKYGVNHAGSPDKYAKGGNMIHTIRHVINNDDKFKSILRGLNKTFYHQTVTTAQVENYISKQSGIDFSKVFEQYLRHTIIPVFEYKINNSEVSFRWNDCVKGFNMPVKLILNGEKWVKPTEKWQTVKMNTGSGNELRIDKNFYVRSDKVD